MSSAHHNRYRPSRVQTVVECKSMQSDIQNTNPSHRDTFSSKTQTPPLQSSSLPPLSVSTNLPPKPTFEPEIPRVSEPLASQPTVQPSILSLCHTDGKSHALPTFTDTILMSLSGVSFSYNLGSIKPDPHEVIELLKVTSSERGNWVHVAAHYRRSGNPRAAIAVVTAMLEGMYSVYSPQLLPER